MRNKFAPIFLGFLLTGAFVMFIFVRQVQAASKAVGGHAWSENIGWIDMAPASGGVLLDDTTGILSGFGWSEHIGWIQFNPVAGFPVAPAYGARINMSTGQASGWAKALTASGNGWDGWINLGVTGGVNLNTSTGAFSGFAWGSDVVGWVNFTGVTTNATPSTCTSAGPDGNTVTASSGGYDIFAYGVQNALDVSFAVWTDNNGQDDLIWYPGVDQGGGTWKATANLANHTGVGVIYVHVYMDIGNVRPDIFCDAADFSRIPESSVSISATPPGVNKNTSTTINWSYSDATLNSCTITGVDSASLSYPSDSGSFDSGPLFIDKIYEINCTPGGPSSYANVTVDILLQNFNINVVKSGQGTVVSSPAGIDCGEGCPSQSNNFLEDTVITLTATPTDNRIFTGWSDTSVCDLENTRQIDGSGGTCKLTANGNKTIYANFAVDPNYKEF